MPSASEIQRLAIPVQPLPRWECPNGEQDQQQLIEWTISRLNELPELPPPPWAKPADALEVLGAYASERGVDILRGLDAGTVKELFVETWRRIMTPTQPRPHGRQTGDRRDLTAGEKYTLYCADADIKRIHDIWKQYLHKDRRGQHKPPTAIEIAAYRWQVDREKLENWRKNKHRAAY